MQTIRYRKLLFLGVFFLSFAVYLPLVINSPTTISLGSFIGFFGLQLILWQVILGNRQVVHLFTKDLLWANKFHRLAGTYGFLIILLHPLIMVSVYGLTLVWPPSFATTFDIGIRLGTFALSILTFIWLTSAVLRGRLLSWRWWKRLHYAAYVLYPILFFHLTITGSSRNRYEWLPIWLFIMNTIFIAIVLLRVAGWAGLTKRQYEVIETTIVARDVTRFRLRPLTKSIRPAMGQFAYLQGWRYGESHPFTVSHYDSDSGEISFSIKAMGPYSRKLTTLKPQDTAFIDGPYGVFTSEIEKVDRQVVVIAGGIGITPFIRHLEAKNIDYLYWGCRSEEDIAYRETVQASGAKIYYMLSEEPKTKEPGYAVGFIDAQLLKATLPEPLSSYDFYICGPPPMMQAVCGQLVNNGVSEAAIRQEKFSL